MGPIREIEMRCAGNVMVATISDGEDEGIIGFTLSSCISSAHIEAVAEVLGRLLSRFPCKPEEMDSRSCDVLLLMACDLAKIDKITMPLFHWIKPLYQDYQISLSGEAFDISKGRLYTWSMEFDPTAAVKKPVLPKVPTEYVWPIDTEDSQSFIHLDDWSNVNPTQFKRADPDQLKQAVLLARHLQIALHGVVVPESEFADFFSSVAGPELLLSCLYGARILLHILSPSSTGLASLYDLEDIIIKISRGTIEGTGITLSLDLINSLPFAGSSDDTQSLEVVIRSRHHARLARCLEAFYIAFSGGQDTWQAFLRCASVCDLQAELIQKGEPVQPPHCQHDYQYIPFHVCQRCFQPVLCTAKRMTQQGYRICQRRS